MGWAFCADGGSLTVRWWAWWEGGVHFRGTYAYFFTVHLTFERFCSNEPYNLNVPMMLPIAPVDRSSAVIICTNRRIMCTGDAFARTKHCQHSDTNTNGAWDIPVAFRYVACDVRELQMNNTVPISVQFTLRALRFRLDSFHGYRLSEGTYINYVRYWLIDEFHSNLLSIILCWMWYI